MKKWKILSLILVMALVVSNALPAAAFAQEGPQVEGSAAAGPRKRRQTRRAILPEPEAGDDPEASRMRRSE